MKVLFFANRMPDLCGAFLHDIDLALELQTRGHMVVFLTIKVPKEGYSGGTYRGFRFLHYTAASSFLDTSNVWICPHSPILPDVRKINSREIQYRKNISPWPSQIQQTATIRPLMHRNKIEIQEPFRGDCITLVNANINKGVQQFLEMARKMPERRFLGVLPYYGERSVPPSPSNVEWVPFNDDVRVILKRTRILLVPSYYESFGRIAVEAMLNRIPVIYSVPVENSVYPGGSTEGLHEWIQPVGIGCVRDNIDQWVTAIRSLDNETAYSELAEHSRQHIEGMNLFVEASRISGLVEQFAQRNPVVVRTESAPVSQISRSSEPGRVREPPAGRPAGVAFSNGRLRIQR
jgi:hypothetical protein